ncbi:hypothetical protein EG327_002615 [Venturia inaequalis]|uniref:Uncharacterized protein n=1 Tax=Venturia inaequalis TaxID=5025 RepID=A0A8H3VG50_VENIN|nr:hypothetical protein EG327_002615 [Venturia inaequalis]
MSVVPAADIMIPHLISVMGQTINASMTNAISVLDNPPDRLVQHVGVDSKSSSNSLERNTVRAIGTTQVQRKSPGAAKEFINDERLS